MYSSVDIAAVCRDLARLDAPLPVVDDLLRAYALPATALQELDAADAAGPALDAVRAHVLGVLAARHRALDVLAATRDAARVSGLPAWSAALPALESAPLGGHDQLLDYVRTDVLDSAWLGDGDVAVCCWPTAVQVVADGVTASCATSVDAELAAALASPWQHWVTSTGAPRAAVPDGPGAEVVAALARRLTADIADRAAEGVVSARAAGVSWAEAMHRACCAAEFVGRTRGLAVAQLHALGALLTATGPRPRPAAVAAVVGAVHAAGVEDLLDVETVTALAAPLRGALRAR